MSDKIDTRNHPAVKALIELRDRLSLSDAVLAKRYISMSKTTWSQLQSGKYDVDDPNPMLEKCESAVQVLADMAERAEAGPHRGKIVELSHIKAAMSGIKKCYGAPQNRLVIFLAPSGGGKTTLLRKIRESYGTACICGEASETWRSSYLNAGSVICKWLGITDKFVNPLKMEGVLFEALTASPRILCIDEGAYCGPEALNLIKAILNQTPTRVVFLAIPELWTRMEGKAYKEAEQLRRRTAAKIVLREVESSDCRRYLASALRGYSAKMEDEPEIVAACALAANRFGLYDTLERICAEVPKESATVSLEVVEAAIKRVEALRS